MIVKVHEHTIEIVKSPVNELEVNVTKMQFEFDEIIPTNYVKKAFFTNGNVSKVIELANDECNIPVEVLYKKGQVRLGVIAYEVQDETLIERFNPRPAYFQVWEGSMVEADNTEPITPTDKEQIEQMLSNIQLGITKEGKIVTITFINKDGSTQTETLEDGKSIEYNWQGTSLGIRQEGEPNYTYVDLKGEKGEPGAIKMIIVAELPTTGADDTIYLVPITPDTTGNNYAEYVYINGAWELLGKIGVQVDLTDYVKNTDYATDSKGGVIRTNNDYGIGMTSIGTLRAIAKTYVQYQALEDRLFISKGTLENVITGKGLTTKSYVDGLVGDIQTLLDNLDSGNGV